MDLTELPQGDVRLLDHRVARELLASTELARVAFVAPDGTPRVFPVIFTWTGEELVFGTYGGHKLAAFRERPTVAVTIDTAGPPPHMLLLRGDVTVSQTDGAPPEYADAQRRYYGAEQAQAVLDDVERSGTRMYRVALRPSWVGVVDFETRLPEVLSRRA
jgi:hypothetical protein